jgi:hypothetical protein
MLDAEEKLERMNEVLGCLAYMLGTPQLYTFLAMIHSQLNDLTISCLRDHNFPSQVSP